jgi:uncharacterized repeat protein (TIGR01451 family)
MLGNHGNRLRRHLRISLLLCPIALATAAGAAAQTVDVAVGDLESDGTITVEFQATVASPVPPGTTQVSNQGTVSGDNLTSFSTDDPDVGGAADPTVTPLNVAVDLVVSKAESVDPVIAGSGVGNLTYVVTVFNNSLYSATGVALSEALTVPAGVSVDSVTPSQGSFASPTWTVGTLMPGASATLTVVLTAGPSAAAGTDVICDTATVTGVNEPLVNTGNDAATECTSVARQVDLQVAKTESADPVVAGSGADNLTYVVTVANAGPSDASGVTLSEALTLPAGVTLSSVTPSQGSFASPTWTVGSLASGANATLTVVLTVGPSAAAGTDVVCDTATVTGANETLIATGDDADTECTSVVRQVDLQVSKSESADPVVAGSGVGNLTYVVTVANAGPSNASGVTLSEVLTLPAGVSLVSVTPSQGSFASPTWTVGNLAAGANATLTVVLTVGPSTAAGTDVICDTATVTGANETLISTGDDADTECTSVVRQVDLVVLKTESVDPALAGAGPGNLTYVVTVANAGPSNASGVTLSEVLTFPAGVSVDSVTPSQGSFASPTWTVGNLASGANATLTVVLTVSAAAAPGTDVICDTATVTGANEPLIATGDDAASECTSIERAADLSITKDDDADPPPAGANLTYTITVDNLGPSNATNVVVTDPLPAAVTYVSDTCGGSNVPPWTWNVGSLAAGASVACDVVVSINPAPPASISNTATVSATEGDPDGGNNSDTETTSLDVTPPTVTNVDSIAPTGGGSLAECETATVDVERLIVTFSEAMTNPPGDGDPGDVTNPASYLLVAPGPDLDFDTTACGGAAGDDVAVPIAGVSYAAGTFKATLTLGAPLAAAQYRFFVCDVLTDLAGNALDGDGAGGAGGDFARNFRADPGNRFANGHFDCDLGGWTVAVATPGEIAWDAQDADGADASGSALTTNLLPGIDTTFTLSQCVAVTPGVMHDLGLRLRLDAATGVTIGFSRSCEFFTAAACTGSLGIAGDTFALQNTGGWLTLDRHLTPPAGAAAARCRFRFNTAAGASFNGRLDRLSLTAPNLIFADGFESGDTSRWSSCVGCPP